MSDIAIAALLAGTILVASTISVEIGLSVALIELLAGVIAGNTFHLAVPEWLTFLGSFAGIVLTFQAGAEVDVPQFRREWRASLAIGLVSFFAPFAVVGSLTYFVLGWNHRQAEIGGLALSTTSLAVVYAVLVETGLNRELVGKRLMSATFVTDLATVAGLTLLFLKPTIWIVPFGVVSLAVIVGLPRIAPWFFSRYGNRVIEPEIKLVFATLFLLMWLGGRANSQAALPAFVLGLVMSGHYVSHRKEQERMRVVVFAFLTPFFFLKGGLNVSAGALWANLGILALLFADKMVPKLGAVYPLARRYTAPHATFTTLLMSTGLTFGTITSLYGLNSGIIDRTKFSLLISVVVLSAIVPTAIAQRFFHPHVESSGEPTPAPLLEAGID
ncbi:MAG TPA: cation:proton antiporter [Gaiellaceae bacterium]|nr:cation:proton antiporter [Gaiellaceae bacterium]